MSTILTDAQVNALEPNDLPYRDKQVQSGDFFPVVVDLSVAGITIGRAILEAVNADSALAARMGYAAVPLSKQQEESLLRSITYIAVLPPSDTDILAYAGAVTHRTTLPASTLSYKPSVGFWRNYAEGVAATVLEIGTGG